MKLTTSATLCCAGLLFSNFLVAQDAPADEPAPAPQPADPPQPQPATPPQPQPAPQPQPTPQPQPAPQPRPATPPAALEPEKPKLDPATMKDYASYGFGYRNGRSFANQTGRFGLKVSDIDREQFLKGLFDALELEDSAIDEDKVNAALSQLSEVIKEREQEVAEQNKKAGEEFLAENKKREGVITTESGLQYEILKEGEGTVHSAPPNGQPPAKQYMVVYRGTLIDGTEFDSSNGKAVPMGLSVIPGFKEALTSMPVGSKWKLYIPSELAYKDSRRSAKLGPNSTLIFELELKEVKEIEQPRSRPGIRPGQPNAQRPRAVSPPVRVPPQRPAGENGKDSKPRARAVSPPVRIPTNPQPKQEPKPEPDAQPESPAKPDSTPESSPEPAPAEQPE